MVSNLAPPSTLTMHDDRKKSESILPSFKDYFFDKGNRKAWLYLFGISLCVLASLGLLYLISTLIPEFMDFLMVKDVSNFLACFAQFSGVSAGLTLVTLVKNLLIKHLSLDWQFWMVRKYTKAYAKDQCYHYIAQEMGLDNIEQRIENDFSQVTFTNLSLIFGGLTAGLNFALFSYQLLSFPVTATVLGIPGPLYLFLGALVIALSVSAITHLIGKSLGKEKAKLEGTKANLRTTLGEFPKNHNKIVSQQSEKYHLNIIERMIDAVKNAAYKKIKTESFLLAFQDFYMKISYFLPYLSGAVLYFAGDLSYVAFSGLAFACGMLSDAASFPVTVYEDYSHRKASLTRTNELHKVITEYHTKLGIHQKFVRQNIKPEGYDLVAADTTKAQSRPKPHVIEVSCNNTGLEYCLLDEEYRFKTGNISWDLLPDFPHTVQEITAKPKKYELIPKILHVIAERGQIKSSQVTPFILNTKLPVEARNPNKKARKATNKDTIHIKRVSIRTGEASEQFILRNLRELRLVKGEHVIIKGRSGTGKSSVLKLITHKLLPGQGKVVIPHDARVMSIPTEATIPEGKTLREALAYPGEITKTDEEYRAILKLVKLDHDLDKIADTLSTGEKKRVFCARALLEKPDWLLLDELDSNLDPAIAEGLYHVMKENLPGTTLVSISHGTNITRFHKRELYFFVDENTKEFSYTSTNIAESKL